MFFAWTITGILQIYSGRFLRHLWKDRLFIHSVCGGIGGFLTLVALLWELSYLDWKLHPKWYIHVSVSIPIVLLLLLLVLGGISALVMRRVVNFDWHT
jgi:hypothetical protein